MITEEIVLANIKCEGCATTITCDLLKIKGVIDAQVINEKDLVKVSYSPATIRPIIIDKLLALGYPEATEKNGLLLKMKSYSSCMLGKINNLAHPKNT